MKSGVAITYAKIKKAPWSDENSFDGGQFSKNSSANQTHQHKWFVFLEKAPFIPFSYLKAFLSILKK